MSKVCTMQKNGFRAVLIPETLVDERVRRFVNQLNAHGKHVRVLRCPLAEEVDPLSLSDRQALCAVQREEDSLEPSHELLSKLGVSSYSEIAVFIQERPHLCEREEQATRSLADLGAQRINVGWTNCFVLSFSDQLVNCGFIYADQGFKLYDYGSEKPQASEHSATAPASVLV